MKNIYCLLCLIFMPIFSYAYSQQKEYSTEELIALNKLKAIYKLNAYAVSDGDLEKARDYVESCNIILEDNIKDTLLKISSVLGDLASSNDVHDKALCSKFIDYIISKGVKEGIDFTIPTNDYYTVRNLPKGYFLAAMYVATENQKTEIFKFLARVMNFKTVYLSDEEYLSQINSDVITNMLSHYYTYAVNQTSIDQCMSDLYALTRYLNRVTEYTYGEKDMLKLDGTGFHHKSHYNNYMYSYESWIKIAYQLKNTPFKVDIGAFERMRKATISMYLMATRSHNNIRYTANSLSGRNPYGKNGVKIQVTQDAFEKLIEIGGDILNEPFDFELAAAYNYFFRSEKYKVYKVNYDGFYQFNYSPIGVYRNENWVVTMRSPTTKFWGAEIYKNTNRFGRYQSHGSLEIMYDGSLSNSGYPEDDMCAGWDWNVVPGTTTVHYSNWLDMMPSNNTSQRFDQYTKTKDFAGALAFGNIGLFAADFDQIDKWGKQVYEPTNLEFKKSVLAIDNMLFCLGSNISSVGNYNDDMNTATNLFQSINQSKDKELKVNSQLIKEKCTLKLNPNKLNWLITPESTAYIIPKGNDEIEVIFDKQKTPRQTGIDANNPSTDVLATKAFINHGVKVFNKKYFFIVMPGVKDTELQEILKQLEKKDKVYEIFRQDSILHAIEYKPKDIWSYSIFTPSDNIDIGLLKSSTTQMLLIIQRLSDSAIRIATCNPNLNPIADKHFGWKSTATNAQIIIKGQWVNRSENKDIMVNQLNGDTQLTFTLTDGEPLYFDLYTYR